ncbi:MAG: class I SAM-dependent rRNA methyltransferase [Planctomycetes bacterium]|nr:class I SAM-dependent rRNA methyltransferase [Planctomycetota bacterium]
MAARPYATLVPRQTHRILAGHCWVFRSEFQTIVGEAVDGEPLEIRDQRGTVVGSGLYSAQSQIAVRLLSRRSVEFDAAFFRDRLRQARALRDQRLGGRPARRLVSSEGDLLPGLIVDQYGDRLVVQTTTVGMDRRLPMWLDLLKAEFSPAQIVERNDLTVRRHEGLPERTGVLHGPADTRLVVRVGRCDVEVDLLDPHKTGSYLDQQLNHEAVARWVVPGARVLDCFCHLAGFGVHALLAGAKEAVAVDSAEASIAGARRSAELAQVGDRLVTHCANAFDWLRAADDARETFDLVVLDPPSFTRNKDSVAGAMRGYKEIHVRGLRRLGVGGRLATFTCSHHVSAAMFLETVLEAAVDARRILRLEETLSASPDHPVLPTIPESQYLKGFVFSVMEAF